MPEVFAPANGPTLKGYRSKHQAQVRRAEFEPPYSQRSRKGPISVGRTVALVFETPETDAYYIVGFFEARGGAEAFSYQLPWDSASLLWSCGEWDVVQIGTIAGEAMMRVTASFKREFDLI